MEDRDYYETGIEKIVGQFGYGFDRKTCRISYPDGTLAGSVIFLEGEERFAVTYVDENLRSRAGHHLEALKGPRGR